MNSDQHQAQIAAERDAEADVSKWVWLLVGFALNVVGILIAYIYQPSPPVSRIHDKSQEYTLFYTDAYQAKIRHIQLIQALIGCIIPVVFGMIVFLTVLGTIFGNMP